MDTMSSNMPDTMTTNPSLFGKFMDLFDGFAHQNDGAITSTDERPEITSASEEDSETADFLKNGSKVNEHQSENGMVGDSKRSPTLSSPTSSNSSDKILKFDGFHLFLSDDEDMKKAMSYKDYDVTGPSHDNPYPWTNVKSVQCDIKLTSSESALQTEKAEHHEEVTLCSQCHKKLSGVEKVSGLRKIFSTRKESVPSRSHSLADSKDTTKSSRKHDRARSTPALGTAHGEADIPENVALNHDSKENGHSIIYDNMVPSPVIHRRMEKRPTVILSHADEDESEKSSFDESQESLFSGVSVSSLDVPIPNLRIKAPLHPQKSNNSDSEGDIDSETKVEPRRRNRRPALAPTTTNEEILIEPPSLPNSEEVGDGRRSLRASMVLPGSSGSVHELEGYMNLKFEDNLSELNDKTMKQMEAQKKKQKRKQKKEKTRAELEEALKKYKIFDHEELEFAKYAQDGMDWLVFMKDVLKTEHITQPNPAEAKRRNKIWELFRSEVVYLVNHILILKNVFQGPLLFLISEYNTFEDIEPRKVFANLDEICTVSTAFCREMYKSLRETTSRDIFAPTAIIVKLLENFDTMIGPAYQTYCMNYDSGAVEYLKKNGENRGDFRNFLELREKECTKSRLMIKDYMAAPIQRITKYPLLLKEIRENTVDHNAKNHLSAVITKVADSISNLEKKVKWLAKFERLKELEEMILWPPTEAVDGRNAVTEFLRTVLAETTQSPNQMLFGSNKRNLASEGPLQMMENNKFVEVYILVFEDLLLLTMKNARKREKKLSTAGISTSIRLSDSHSIIPKSSECTLNVYKQPIPLDRISIIDMDQEHGVDLGVKSIFALVQFSRYGQPTSVTVLAAQTEPIKNKWIQIIESTRDKCIQIQKESPERKSSNSKKRNSYDQRNSFLEYT